LEIISKKVTTQPLRRKGTKIINSTRIARIRRIDTDKNLATNTHELTLMNKFVPIRVH